MAENDIHIDALPEQVFSVLEEPESFGDWVVGSKLIRDADPDWPAIESKFHHTVGFGPVDLDDHTRVQELARPSRMVLRAKTRPFGAANVELRLEPEGRGTHVTMEENPVGIRAELVNPLFELLVRRRNEESLHRLKRLAEERAARSRAVGPRSG